MQVRVLFRRVDAMDVNIDSWGHDAKSVNASLFFGLTQSDVREIRIAIGVPTRLKPPSQLGMEKHETCHATGINNKGRPGEMARSTGSYRNVLVLVDQVQNSLAVLVKALANGGLQKLPGQAAIVARFEGDRIRGESK